MNVSSSDRAAIRSTIERQLAAFQKDDAIEAFSFASLGIQAQFLTADNFLKMVKTQYQAVYRPRSVIFEDLTEIQGFPAQLLMLLDAAGNVVKAVYLMEKCPNGHWRINGCYLIPVDAEES